jgi:hypothetical protein
VSETRRPEAHPHAMVKLGSKRGKTDGDPKARSSRKQAHSAETTNHVRYIDKGDTGHMCSEGAIGRYYHAASRFSTLHSTRFRIGTPILRTSRPVVRRPNFRTPFLSEFVSFYNTQPPYTYSFSDRPFDVHSDRTDSERRLAQIYPRSTSDGLGGG